MASMEELRSYYDATLPYYDLSLEDRGDLPFWTSMARRWDAKSILDLGCGTGRVTTVLGAHATITAVDVLVEMLRRARRRAPEAHFVAGDLREFAFTAKFDLVIFADDPMAHLTSSADRRRVIRNVADHLAPEGRVVIEGLYRSSASVQDLPPRVVVSDGRPRFSIAETWRPARQPALWDATYRYTTGSSVVEVTTTLRSWSDEEIGALPESGLKVEFLWGDFDERPFSDTSQRMVIVARRTSPVSRRSA